MRLSRRHRLIDAHRIYPGLWQGSIPPQGGLLDRAGFDVLVLAAEEHQPPAERFPGVRVVHAPLDDDLRGMSRSHRRLWRSASREIAAALCHGKRVLVTCAAGRNRSGVLNAEALKQLGMPASAAVLLVKASRPNALTNKAFVRMLLDRPPRRSPGRLP